MSEHVRHHEIIRPTIEITNITKDYSQVAYHGLKSTIAERREAFSASRKEKMAHKDTLYAGLGALAEASASGKSKEAEVSLVKPRSRHERRVDRRIDKKALKRNRAITDEALAKKVFGSRESLTGKNNKERKQEKKAIDKQLKKGVITASEARLSRTNVDAQRLKHGELMHRRAGDKLHGKRWKLGRDGAQSKLDRAISQPISSRWRTSRKNEAVRDIERHKARAEKHNQKAAKARARI